MLSKNIEKEDSTVIFDDVLLQVIMGQWLGILPSSIKKGFLFFHYYQPQESKELLYGNKVTKKKLKQIETQFINLMNIFGLEDDIYVIKDFDRDNNLFNCNLFNKKETASIKYIFDNFLTFPSAFIVNYEGIVSKYSFITDKVSYENILISIQREKRNFIENANLSSYKIEAFNKALNITVEYFKQLKSLDELNSLIDINGVNAFLEDSNILQQSLIDVSKIFSECLRKNISSYRKVQLSFIQNIDGNNCKSKLEISNGQIKELIIANHDSNSEKKDEIISIFNTSNNYQKVEKTINRK